MWWAGLGDTQRMFPSLHAEPSRLAQVEWNTQGVKGRGTLPSLLIFFRHRTPEFWWVGH